jgi:hypothetical protein
MRSSHSATAVAAGLQVTPELGKVGTSTGRVLVAPRIAAWSGG